MLSAASIGLRPVQTKVVVKSRNAARCKEPSVFDEACMTDCKLAVRRGIGDRIICAADEFARGEVIIRCCWNLLRLRFLGLGRFDVLLKKPAQVDAALLIPLRVGYVAWVVAECAAVVLLKTIVAPTRGMGELCRGRWDKHCETGDEEQERQKGECIAATR